MRRSAETPLRRDPAEMNMPPRRDLRFFAIGSTKIPLLTELKIMNAIPADEFTHDVFLSHSSKDKAVVRGVAGAVAEGRAARVAR
jgi:hypothetical protein